MSEIGPGVFAGPAGNASRDRVIVRTSVIGILANILLAAFKAVVGLASHSIAIVLDAVNNLSDAGASVITIVGTKLAGKQPDRKHPFGHGRVEYLSAMIISVIILYAGITSLVESIKKIIRPETPDYSTAALIIVASAVVVKFLLGRYVKGVGKRVASDPLIESGTDASMDAVISAATLVAAAVYLIWHISLEAWLAAVISLIIIKAGIDMLRETLSEILGERVDAQLAHDIKETVASFEGVSGVYDLVLHDYGPGNFNGSVHVEIPDTYSAEQIDEMLRDIAYAVYEKHHVILTAIGVYSVNTTDPVIVAARRNVERIVFSHEHVLQLHGFSYSEARKQIRFDVVLSFDSPDRNKLFEEVCADVRKAYPGFAVVATPDVDFSES